MDALSGVLDLIRLQGAVYFRADFPAPWGMRMDAGGMAQFHMIVRGHCVLEVPGRDDPVLPLSAGDIVVFPHGDAHALADRAGSDKLPGLQVLQAHQAGRPPFAGAGPATTIVCGHFEFDRRFDHRLLGDLPPLIHVAQSAPHQLSWLETVTAAIIQETGSGRPGADTVARRLAEVLFVQILRTHIAQAAPARGYLAALGDARISDAIRIIHGGAHTSLSLDGIARAVAMSRSAFANRFRELVGVTPIRYLTEWRMLKARELLETTSLPIPAVSERVGYMSEAAFNRAFKRAFGQGPGALRRAARL